MGINRSIKRNRFDVEKALKKVSFPMDSTKSAKRPRRHFNKNKNSDAVVEDTPTEVQEEA